MNKRQAKKAHKKAVHPFVDEMNLLTLDEDEYKKAIADYEEYVYKHCRFKHYKDQDKIFHSAIYSFPVGKAYQDHMKELLKNCRKRDVKVQIVFQL